MKTSSLLYYQNFIAQYLNQLRHRVPLTFICKAVNLLIFMQLFVQWLLTAKQNAICSFQEISFPSRLTRPVKEESSLKRDTIFDITAPLYMTSKKVFSKYCGISKAKAIHSVHSMTQAFYSMSTSESFQTEINTTLLRSAREMEPSVWGLSQPICS